MKLLIQPQPKGHTSYGDHTYVAQQIRAGYPFIGLFNEYIVFGRRNFRD